MHGMHVNIDNDSRLGIVFGFLIYFSKPKVK